MASHESPGSDPTSALEEAFCPGPLRPVVVRSSAIVWLVTETLAIALPFAVYTLAYFIYQAISLPMNFLGRSFDLAGHRARVAQWWPASYPSVDVFLPICGEPIELLRNTWNAVSDLIEDYQGEARAYVLDDGPSEEARSMAGSFGFSYIHRPDWPAGKKAGTSTGPVACSSDCLRTLCSSRMLPGQG